MPLLYINTNFVTGNTENVSSVFFNDQKEVNTMIKTIEAVNLFSEDANSLAGFYKDKLGLKSSLEGEMGKEGEKVFGFELGEGSSLYIIDHSEIKGGNKQPQRQIINFAVEDVEKAVKKLDEKKVKKIQDTYHVEGYGLIATFEDTDGNFFQLVQVRG
jgi:predicted enzyme related to lactoylglutathione lyase